MTYWKVHRGIFTFGNAGTHIRKMHGQESTFPCPQSERSGKNHLERTIWKNHVEEPCGKNNLEEPCGRNHVERSHPRLRRLYEKRWSAAAPGCAGFKPLQVSVHDFRAAEKPFLEFALYQCTRLRVP